MVKFSIIIPVYNKEAFLAKTLQSVLDQEYPYFEILILNDGSTDNSQQIIDAFTDNRIKSFTGKNIGAGAARNFLIDKAQNNYIAFLDADDLWTKQHLQEITRLIAKYPNEKVFATNSVKLIENTLIKRNFSVDTSSTTELVTDFFEASFLDCILTTPSSVLHKSVFISCGKYNTAIKSGQDIDLFIRIGAKFKVVFSPTVTVKVIGNLKSLSNSTSYKEKMNFETAWELEKEDPSIKKYFDLNRYALAIMAKEQGYKTSFTKLVNLINPKNLHWKQRLLLKLPATLLTLLLKIKQTLFSFGYSFTVFK